MRISKIDGYQTSEIQITDDEPLLCRPLPHSIASSEHAFPRRSPVENNDGARAFLDAPVLRSSGFVRAIDAIVHCPPTTCMQRTLSTSFHGRSVQIQHLASCISIQTLPGNGTALFLSQHKRQTLIQTGPLPSFRPGLRLFLSSRILLLEHSASAPGSPSHVRGCSL